MYITLLNSLEFKGIAHVTIRGCAVGLSFLMFEKTFFHINQVSSISGQAQVHLSEPLSSCFLPVVCNKCVNNTTCTFVVLSLVFCRALMVRLFLFTRGNDFVSVILHGN